LINAGSQIILCDLPVRLDNYVGCGHACSYCFVNRKIDISKIKPVESGKSLLKWIKGGRSRELSMFDYDIPLHWGGLSDPFQPLEKQTRDSLKLLKIFIESQYPVVISTKGICVKEKQYINALKNIRGVLQVSLSCKEVERYEQKAPIFKERLSIVESLSKYIRVNIRVQPFFPQYFSSILKNIKLFADSGAYGVIFESIKYLSKQRGCEKLGADFVYPINILKPMFLRLKNECHKYGLKFYSGENRLRKLSDNLCCCGIEGLGFKTHTNNLNHIFFEKEFKAEQTAGQLAESVAVRLNQRTTTQRAVNKASAISRLHQDSIADSMSYEDFIIQLSKIKQYQDIMGLNN